MSKPKKLIKDRLIGKQVTIVTSANKQLIGVVGKIIDETKNTFKFETRVKQEKDQQKIMIKQIPKQNIIFQIKTSNNELKQIHGEQTIGRIEERIKK